MTEARTPYADLINTVFHNRKHGLRFFKNNKRTRFNSEDEVTQKFACKGLVGFVQKPYRVSILKEAIKSI
jgi:hypothetical protein